MASGLTFSYTIIGWTGEGGGLSLGIRLPEREVDQYSKLSAKTKNEWSYTSSSTYVYVAWYSINPLNAKLNPIYHLLALLGAGHIFHVSRLRVKEMKSLHLG